jgi:restriction endonuclease Mrr
MLNEATIDTLLALDGEEFPLAMGLVLAAHRYRNVKVVDGPGDHGIDIICLSPDGKRVVAVQCKRYEHGKVVEKELREFLGAAYHDNLKRGTLVGLFFTTADFNDSARSFARAHEDPERRYQVSLRLYNGEQLVEMVRSLAVR